MKEYGGFLPLELPHKKEYFSDVEDENIVRLNCGRSTFYYAVKDGGFKTVYMPYLNCINSVDPIIDAGAEVKYYYLDDDLTPKDVELNDDSEALLWVNYYGNAGAKQIEKVTKKYKNLIIDNCHAFFTKIQSDAYNCYSTRKFFGVADGAYLIKKNLKKFDLPESKSAEDTLFILKEIEVGTNAVYGENLENEKRVAEEVAHMSPLTQRILSSIDYKDIQEHRYRNIVRLQENLGDFNEFAVNMEAKTQMYYPFLYFQDSLRGRLIENKIYNPTWWRHVPEQSGYSKLETQLSNYMIMLPIDQRYTEDDMDYISEVVRKCIDK